MIRLDDLPNPQRRALEMVREVAADKNCRPFLVGGPVRDVHHRIQLHHFNGRHQAAVVYDFHGQVRLAIGDAAVDGSADARRFRRIDRIEIERKMKARGT